MSDTNAKSVEVTELRKQFQQYLQRTGEQADDRYRHLQGRILTIIDSAIQDPEQRKATKDLINSSWWETSPLYGKTEGEMFCESLGFELYDSSIMPSNTPEEWNPYKN